MKVSGTVGLRHLAHTLLRRYPRRTVLGLSLMLAQAFLYNSIFFSYALILEKFHGVPAGQVGLYIVPFADRQLPRSAAARSSLRSLGATGHDPVDLCAIGTAAVPTGGLFVAGVLTALTQTLAWMLVFFVASAAASSAYLTVGELFPVDLRGMAIAVFYAFGTLVGAGAPALFGAIVETGDPYRLLAGYALAAVLMIAAAFVGRARLASMRSAARWRRSAARTLRRSQPTCASHGTVERSRGILATLERMSWRAAGLARRRASPLYYRTNHEEVRCPRRESCYPPLPPVPRSC